MWLDLVSNQTEISKETAKQTSVKIITVMIKELEYCTHKHTPYTKDQYLPSYVCISECIHNVFSLNKFFLSV